MPFETDTFPPMPLLVLALAGFVAALLVALVLTPRVRRLAFQRGWVDRPDGERKLHKMPTPAVGGLAIFAGAVAGMGVIVFAAPSLGVSSLQLPLVVILGSIVMVGTGLWDDLHGLGFKTKLAVEIVVAYALLLSDPAYLLDLTAVPFIGGDSYTHALFAIPITLAWIVGVMNAINLIDGVDGLAAGVGVIAFASLAIAFGGAEVPVLLLMAVVMIGGLLGFLKHNFNPASIFMGDSGSLFVGFILAVYTLSGTGHAHPLVALAIPILALGLPIFDTVLSMVRRAIGRQAICAPDRDHIHHRMTERRSVRSAVVSLYMVAGAFGLIAIAMSVLPASATPWLLGLAILGAAAFATTLGYVRRPYMSPALIETAPPAPDAMKVTASATGGVGMRDVTQGAERIGESGDGMIVAAQMESMRELGTSSDITFSPSP